MRANPPPLHAPGPAFNTQSHAEFDANWDRQVGCPGQYDSGASRSVWSNLVVSASAGAKWGDGVRRAQQNTVCGWTAEEVKKTMIRTLMISGALDKQVDPQRVR